jgi:prepilin peptidase CpaA
MSMHPIAWWLTLTLLAIATVVDIHSRRIPNWLVLPFLAAGVIVNTASYGERGLGQSMGGIALAAAVTGVLCWLRGMGMGDLKLCAAVAAYHESLGESLEGAGDLVSAFWTKGPHSRLVLDNPSARALPYAPAIAIGTIFSFFAG